MIGSENIKILETKYLDAKIAYYSGHPIIDDTSFDILENKLKSLNSKVIEQVGYKQSDFDYDHFSVMLSLDKIQTEKNEKLIIYKNTEFLKWYNSCTNQKDILIEYTPKYDGNAINIIYHGNKLHKILTRGDGKQGKDITNKLKSLIPEKLDYNILISDNDILEIRCEAIIPKNIFDKEYSDKFANARNLVAGVLGKDKIDLNYINNIHIMPIHFILNLKHVNFDIIKNEFFKIKNITIASQYEYENVIKKYEKLRNTFEYNLDGVVVSFPYNFRDSIGYNEHHYKFAIAIKFVPDEVVTEVIGIERNIGKTGELTPVVLLKPVELVGTTVKRTSGYNEGYIINNKIGVGSFVTITKAGDIIPEIQSVVVESIEPFHAPTECPCCGTTLTFDGIHLMCPNSLCEAVVAKKLSYAVDMLDLKRIGGKTIEPFAKVYNNMFELMYAVLTGTAGDYEKYGIKPCSRSHELFIQAFTNIKSLKYSQVILMMCYDGIGRKLSEQAAREYCGLKPDYTSMERALVAKLQEPDVKAYIMHAVSELENLGIVIDTPKDKVIDTTSIKVCMTGSPKEFGFKTKEEWIKQFPNVIETDIKEASYLITDSYSSSSSKMKTAEKKGITIKTYGDFKI